MQIHLHRHLTRFMAINKTGQRVPLYSSSFPGEYFGLQVYFYVNFYENLTLFNSSLSRSWWTSGASGVLIIKLKIVLI
jgi:hypothetical protein